jgi:hypothetical protein
VGFESLLGYIGKIGSDKNERMRRKSSLTRLEEQKL